MASVTVESDITGKVWKIVAPPSTAVAEADVILIIESMKMEIEVTAPKAGVVGEIFFAEGDDVLEGQALARIDGVA
jgi:biotin carboxyl carrier protein